MDVTSRRVTCACDAAAAACRPRRLRHARHRRRQEDDHADRRQPHAGALAHRRRGEARPDTRQRIRWCCRPRSRTPDWPQAGGNAAKAAGHAGSVGRAGARLDRDCRRQQRPPPPRRGAGRRRRGAVRGRHRRHGPRVRRCDRCPPLVAPDRGRQGHEGRRVRRWRDLFRQSCLRQQRRGRRGRARCRDRRRGGGASSPRARCAVRRRWRSTPST